MDEDHRSCLGPPDGYSLEAGEHSVGDASGVYEPAFPSPEPEVQVLSHRVPEGARGQFVWEVFEGPDERLVDRDEASGFAVLREGFHVEELAEEAEERAERFMAAHRQLVSAFFARRRNPLYRRAAASALVDPDRPESALALLWSLVGDRWMETDPGTQEEVSRWLSGLAEDDFLFFTQDPDGDPQRVMGSGILPTDLRPVRLFRDQRRRVLRVLMKESSFFHPDQGVFEAQLDQKLPYIAQAWHLDQAPLRDLARGERARFYRLHLEVCRASAAFARSKPAPATVSAEVVAEVAAVAYGRMNHPSYKAQALAFAGLSADDATARFGRLDRFMEDFYASRLFSFLKRAVKRRREKKSDPVVEVFVKTFRTGMRPAGVDVAAAKQVAALAFFESRYGGFRGTRRRSRSRRWRSSNPATADFGDPASRPRGRARATGPRSSPGAASRIWPRRGRCIGPCRTGTPFGARFSPHWPRWPKESASGGLKHSWNRPAGPTGCWRRRLGRRTTLSRICDQPSNGSWAPAPRKMSCGRRYSPRSGGACSTCPHRHRITHPNTAVLPPSAVRKVSKYGTSEWELDHLLLPVTSTLNR